MAFCLSLTVVEVDMNTGKEKSWTKYHFKNVAAHICLSIVLLHIKIVVSVFSGHCVFGRDVVYSYSMKALSIEALMLMRKSNLYYFIIF